MATAASMITSLLLTSVALMGLLTTAAHARPLPPEDSGNKFMMIIMINNMRRSSKETMEIARNDHSCNHTPESSLIKGKVAPSPPSPESSPSTHQGAKLDNGKSSSSSSTPSCLLELVSFCEEGSPCNSLISMFANFGKTPKSPPSPNPAPSQHQGTLIQQYVQRRSPPAFKLKSIFTNFGKTPLWPPSPNAAPSRHQGIIEQPVEQRPPSDFQFA